MRNSPSAARRRYRQRLFYSLIASERCGVEPRACLGEAIRSPGVVTLARDLK